MSYYPLLMAPHFRSGAETPWGGDMLRDAFLKDAPEQTGESLEVSAIEGCESMVRNGVHAGKTLTRMAELWGSALTGSEGGSFPLTLKLADAAKEQPAKVYAGNTAAWMILNCDADGEIVCGMQADGERRVKVRPGDVYYIPEGLLHAAGSGIQYYAISGFGEEAGAGAADPQAASEKIFGTTYLCKGGSRTCYAADKRFTFCRLNLSGRMPLDDGRMLFLTPLGPCRIGWEDETMDLMPFDTVVIPAALTGAWLESEDCKVLLSCVSDREALRAQLGYRSENVAGLVD